MNCAPNYDNDTTQAFSFSASHSVVYLPKTTLAPFSALADSVQQI